MKKLIDIPETNKVLEKLQIKAIKANALINGKTKTLKSK